MCVLHLCCERRTPPLCLRSLPWTSWTGHVPHTMRPCRRAPRSTAASFLPLRATGGCGGPTGWGWLVARGAHAGKAHACMQSLFCSRWTVSTVGGEPAQRAGARERPPTSAHTYTPLSPPCSFILCFHSATDAASFCCKVQARLLAVDWWVLYSWVWPGWAPFQKPPR